MEQKKNEIILFTMFVIIGMFFVYLTKNIFEKSLLILGNYLIMPGVIFASFFNVSDATILLYLFNGFFYGLMGYLIFKSKTKSTKNFRKFSQLSILSILSIIVIIIMAFGYVNPYTGAFVSTDGIERVAPSSPDLLYSWMTEKGYSLNPMEDFSFMPSSYNQISKGPYFSIYKTTGLSVSIEYAPFATEEKLLGFNCPEYVAYKTSKESSESCVGFSNCNLYYDYSACKVHTGCNWVTNNGYCKGVRGCEYFFNSKDCYNNTGCLWTIDMLESEDFGYLYYNYLDSNFVCPSENEFLEVSDYGSFESLWYESEIPSEKTGTECNNNESKWDKCNYCICENGYLTCTEMSCEECNGTWANGECNEYEIIKEAVCVENEKKWDECNYCNCIDGQWTCTNELCSPCDNEWQNGKCKTFEINKIIDNYGLYFIIGILVILIIALIPGRNKRNKKTKYKRY